MSAITASRCLFLARLTFVGFTLLGQSISALQATPENDVTEEAFRNPPISARPGAFWPWLNGTADWQRITYELEEMKAKGMSGADIWDVQAAVDPRREIPAGPAFLSEESLKTIGHAVREADRLGLRLGMVAASGWNAGGTWVEPQVAGIGLFSSKISVEGPNQFSQELPFPSVPEKCPKDAAGLPVFFREVAVLAFPQNRDQDTTSSAATVDLHEHLDDKGRLTWEVPKGKWTILRLISANTGYSLIVPSPNSKGPMIDFLNPDATQKYFQYIVDRLGDELGDISKSSLKYLEVDSMELGDHTAWTGRMLEEFTRQHRYNPLPYLPALKGWTVDNEDITQRFMYDWRRTISDVFIESHYRTGSKLLGQYGLQLCAEAGGPGAPIWPSCPVDALKALGAVDILRGEFWPKFRNMRLVKEVASAAHIYGKRIVDAESFTSWRHWQDGPYFHKQLADNAFGEGLNHVTFHTFTHSPTAAGLPGRAYHAGTHINPNCAWWPMGRPFIDYLSRCSYLLQKGHFVADVCFYYGGEAPNFVPSKHNGFSPGAGYDYDVTNSDVILQRMTVKDRKILLPDGMSYSLLVLPDQEDMDLAVLKKLESLIREGATVVGPKPTRTATLADYSERDRQLRLLAEKIWGKGDRGLKNERAYGKGRVISNCSIEDVLRTAGIKQDFSYKGADERTRLDYIHRRTDKIDIYFVTNRNERWETVDCTFRVTGKQPELWHPDTGRTRDILVYKIHDGRTSMPLHLAPAESVFVVFRVPASPVHFTRVDHPVAQATKGKPALLTHSATPGGPVWLSDGKGDVADQSIIFDLGDVHSLKKIRFWNYNENVQGRLNYGVKEMDILVSSDNVTFVNSLSCSLQIAPDYEDKMYYEDIPLTAEDVRYIRLDIKSNQNMPKYSDGVTKYVGLSKVAFFGEQEIHGVKVQSFSSGQAFDPASDEDLGVDRQCELRRDQSGTTYLRAWRPGIFKLFDSTGHLRNVEIPSVPEPSGITGSWQVDFSPGWGAPTSTTFEKLISWTDAKEDGIKYYSGIAVYQKQFDMPRELVDLDSHLELDLGIVQKVARVTLNGQPLGILWKPPFRIAVSDVIHPGKNELIVEVANTWTNRLIGDAFLPASKHYCKTNLHSKLAQRERQLQPSGLMGPVRLYMAHHVRGTSMHILKENPAKGDRHLAN